MNVAAHLNQKEAFHIESSINILFLCHASHETEFFFWFLLRMSLIHNHST